MTPRAARRTGPAAPGPVPFLAQSLDRVTGTKTAAALRKLGLHTVEDLLRHAPRRYVDFGEVTTMADLELDEHHTVMARVMDVNLRKMRARKGAILTAHITDGEQVLQLTFFGSHEGALMGHLKRLQPGRIGLFSGVLSDYRGVLQLTHPAVSMAEDDSELGAVMDRHMRPVPVYPASAQITSWQISTVVNLVLEQLDRRDVPEIVPAPVRRAERILGRYEALQSLHRPNTHSDWEWAQNTVRFQEAFVLQTLLGRRRQQALRQQAVARPGRSDGVLAAFDESLPFTLTEGQVAVGQELAHDLAGEVPMLRLLQGEVGSGKTVVALRAMLQVVDSGGQAALLAPTEVLAAQHLRSVTALLGGLAASDGSGASAGGVRVVLLTASLPAAQRRKALEEVATGAASIVIGTHALFSEDVQFADLGLVVVDEQHRFGVEQRDLLRNQGEYLAHSLVMTATPIPRTVAMTAFGDLEVSQLVELPAGRPDVATHLINWEKESWVTRMWERCREEVAAGGRVYVVCPRIDAHDDGTEDDGQPDALLDPEGNLIKPKRPLAAVLDLVKELRELPALQGTPVGMLHGRMTMEAKEAAMAAFASGEVPVLVSTTVVEVGVDVPEASVMVILDADRFGISQLHQLRGRIGRGGRGAGSGPVPPGSPVPPGREGVCFAVSTHAGDKGPTGERLTAFASSRDGFWLAERDLELRREGDVLGAAQSGRASSLITLRVLRDREVITAARDHAYRLLDKDPDLKTVPGLRLELERIEASEAAEFLERA